MNWKLSYAQKIRAGSALLIVFLMVLATNMIDNHHFEIVQNSITTVYEDRLVSKDYIYKITRQLQLKNNDCNTPDLININSQANDSIQVLMEKYSTTKLTPKESKLFELLKKNLEQLYAYERELQEGETSLNKELSLSNVKEDYYIKIAQNLDALSEIQIIEGKRELFSSSRAIESSNFISKLEIGVLIFIGILIQLLIFLKPFK